jgi:hypothetical protein
VIVREEAAGALQRVLRVNSQVYLLPRAFTFVENSLKSGPDEKFESKLILNANQAMHEIYVSGRTFTWRFDVCVVFCMVDCWLLRLVCLKFQSNHRLASTIRCRSHERLHKNFFILPGFGLYS